MLASSGSSVETNHCQVARFGLVGDEVVVVDAEIGDHETAGLQQGQVAHR
jgi:hypothetical protein